MLFTGSVFVSYLCISACLYVSACSSEPDEPPDDDGKDECVQDCPSATGDLTQPATSFSADVFPIFARHCSDRLCHGAEEGSRAMLYLGPETGATAEDIQSIYDDLQRPSKTAPARMLIEAGNPSDSFMMNKVDGCQNSLGLTCSSDPNLCLADCGEPMPPLPRAAYPALSNDEKQTLRRWIAQGAPP